MTITIGQTVSRIASDYTNGRRGRVIELDNLRPRARVEWELVGRKLRTWVRICDLAPLAAPPQPDATSPVIAPA